MNSSRLCIVELPELRRLVIGDAVATIVMSLLDDMNSKNHIHTLRMHVNEHLHRERNERLGEINEARMLRERLMRNRIGIVARRNTELLPRLWSALLRRPLGERLTFTAMNRGRPNIWLDGCETRFETTSQAERQVLYSMLHASGWVRDQDEERLRGNTRISHQDRHGAEGPRSARRVFLRTDGGRGGAGRRGEVHPRPPVNILREGESRHRRTASRYRPVDRMSA